MMAFYLLGVAASDDGASWSYARTIFTWFILSGFVFAHLSGQLRPDRALTPRVHRIAHRIGLACLVLWASFAIYYLRSATIGGQTDFRKITSGHYITLADTIALFGLCSLLRRDIRVFEAVLFFLGCLLALVIAGSRPSMTLFGLIGLIILVARTPWRVSLPVAAVAIVAALATVLAFGGGASWLQRLTSMFSPGGDTSLIVRFELFAQFWLHLVQHPGCALAPCPPEDGRYAHNILSLIQYFGILGVVMTLAFIVTTVAGLRRILASEDWPLYAYSLTLVFLARSWTNLVFAVGLGLVMVSLEEQRLRRRWPRPAKPSSQVPY